MNLKIPADIFSLTLKLINFVLVPNYLQFPCRVYGGGNRKEAEKVHR